MADVTTYEDVPLPAEKVWGVIGHFDHIRKWAVAIPDESLVEDGGQKIRVLAMPDGIVVKEALVVDSQFSYTYTVLEHPTVKDYRSTVAAIPLDESNCRIELIMHVGASDGESNEDLTARYTRFARGNLKAMKRALGLA